MGSIPQATLNRSGLVYVGEEMSLQTLKAVYMIVEINHSYESEYSRTVCFYRQATVRKGPCLRY
jgi:hypothetical protein